MQRRDLRGGACVLDLKMPRDSCVVATLFVTTLLISVVPAKAGAWIPAAGTGDVESMLRYSFADRSFDANSFSPKTHASTKEHATQIRLTGEHGLGYGLSLVYDFRYAFLYHSKTKKGVTVIDSNNGLQEQRLGLNYGLTQGKNFADAIGLSIIYPGSPAGAKPALDCGQWAFEPDYLIGFKPGFWGLTANLKLGARVFLDGGVTQFRMHFEVGAPVTHRVRLVGKLFFVRSALMSGYDSVRDRGERYDLLRLGIGVQFRVTKSIEPILAYDADVAGMGAHANHRFTVGVKVKY